MMHTLAHYYIRAINLVSGAHIILNGVSLDGELLSMLSSVMVYEQIPEESYP